MAETIIMHSDCRNLHGAIKQPFQMSFCDPPFNIGESYNGYDDNMMDEEYDHFTYEWLQMVLDVTQGIICLHGPDHVIDLYQKHMYHMRHRARRVSWVIWHYRFGQCGRSNWINSHCHCLIYSTNGISYRWNPDAVLVESDRSSTYDDPRIFDSERGGRRLPFTVWGIPSDGPYWGRVQGNNRERRDGHPNQLPEVYLERLIKAYTNPGDWILDPFGGSGTTIVVAKALERNCVTCDISAANCESISQRLEKGAMRV